jgi:nitroreductase
MVRTEAQWSQDAIARCVAGVVRSRRAVRAFKAEPLHRDLVEQILFRTRLTDFGARYYASLGIDRNDASARMRQSERNFSFFGAPVGLIFSIDRRLKPHSWIDLGLFAQTVMIAAKARGVDTCPQVSFAPFHDLIASHLHLPPEEITAFGMSMGYGDHEAEVNQTSMPRARVPDFARLFGFPA